MRVHLVLFVSFAACTPSLGKVVDQNADFSRGLHDALSRAADRIDAMTAVPSDATCRATDLRFDRKGGNVDFLMVGHVRGEHQIGFGSPGDKLYDKDFQLGVNTDLHRVLDLGSSLTPEQRGASAGLVPRWFEAARKLDWVILGKMESYARGTLVMGYHVVDARSGGIRCSFAVTTVENGRGPYAYKVVRKYLGGPRAGESEVVSRGVDSGSHLYAQAGQDLEKALAERFGIEVPPGTF